MKDTMQPTKPEDYELAIPTDPKILKKEIEEILVPETSTSLDMERFAYKIEGFKDNKKCTCPIKIESKKRKRSGKITITKQNNGYSSGFCPVHNNR